MHNFNKDELKYLFTFCTTCDGRGYEYRASHDCWGKPEWDTVVCPICNGYGFKIHEALLQAVKEVVLDP